MSELDDGEYELKDEELVDFEGSDYGFGSDEELELEDGENAALPTETGEKVPAEDVFEAEEMELEGKKGDLEPAPKGKPPIPAETERQEGAESGEIEEEKEEKDDDVVAQPVPSWSSLAYREGYRHEGRVKESRRRHRKADLEDGELDDAAMPDGSDHEAEGNADDDEEDGKDRRERKRRKDRFAAERHSEDLDRKERELGSIMSGPPRPHRVRGSDRNMDRSGGVPKAGNGVGRGMMHMSGFGQLPNMAPGIMGPGGPIVPLDMGPPMALHPVGRGFMGPLGGMPLPGPISMTQFQEAMAVHEHMMRSHRMMQQFAHAAAGPGQPMTGPLGGPAVRSMMGLEFGGPLPRGILHMQPQGPDMAAQMSFAGPMDAYPRNARTGYGSGRAASAAEGIYGQGTGRMGSSPRNGMGGQGPWPVASAEGSDLHPGGRGRGHAVPPAWVDTQGMAIPPVPTAQGVAQKVNTGHAMDRGVVGSRAAKTQRGPCVSTAQANHCQRGGVTNNKRTDPDGTWKIDGDRSTSNGVQNARTASTNRQSSSAGAGNRRERENGCDKLLVSNSNYSHSANEKFSGNGANTASNLIQLGGPVQKSRFLTVSGLPENTPMAVVVEAFEKQGKVMDLKKEDKGDAFTITFATVPEAISAKRHLHRSVVAGQQITVEYAVQRSKS